MKYKKLKTEILLGAFGISALIVIFSMAAVIFIINKQNESLSFSILRKSFHVILDDIKIRESNLLKTANQLASIDKIGITIKFMVNYGKYNSDNVSLQSTYKNFSLQLNEICQAADIWKIAVYDYEGDILFFAVNIDNNTFSGYAEGYPQPTFHFLESNSEKNSTWKKQDSFNMLKKSLDEGISQNQEVFFEQEDQFVSIVAHVPIIDISNENKILGMVKAIIPLDQDFIDRLSRLTETKINIFNKKEFIVGYMKCYKELIIAKQKTDEKDFQNLPLNFCEITHKKMPYIQAAYPLYKNQTKIGTIAALYSKEIARKNTLQMVQTLVFIALICIGIIIPMAYFFSKTITKPINQVVKALKDGIASGDFKQTINIKHKGEIGELVIAFKTMHRTINNVSNELKHLIYNIQNGRLDFRANTMIFEGEWRSLIFGINNVVNAFIEPIDTTAKKIDSIAKGELPEKIVENFKGDFNLTIKNLNALIDATRITTKIAEEIADGNLNIEVSERSENDRMMAALNLMIKKLNQIMDETNNMIQAVKKGSLNIRGNTVIFQGVWREMVSGINRLIEDLSISVSESAALSQEMELARQIQTSLLPVNIDNINPDLIIAAHMTPAEQVGGDFYDITFDKSGCLWLAIGDVSGHGLTSGLIMMMVQTIFTTLTTKFDYDPKKMVVTINEVLYKNVCIRLNERHFMTFTALKYNGNGLFYYAGAHLTMLIFRQKTQSFDYIKTTGIYLNLKKDISRSITNASLYLDFNDILILYTDGLTESLNKDEKILDIDGFVQIINKYIDQPPEIMKNMIIDDVKKWCNNRLYDDITLIIIKRKEPNE